MNKAEQIYGPSRTSFWASILVLVLIGLAIFVAFKLAASLIGV
jgi:hypothetical protein